MERLKSFVQIGASVREFAQPQPTVLQAIQHTRRGLAKRGLSTITHLFDGETSEADEDQAMTVLLGQERADELMFLVNELTWDRLDDELDEPDLDRISEELGRLIDKRDYHVTALLERAFGPTVPGSDRELRSAAATIPFEIRQHLADDVADKRDGLLDGVSRMALRGLPTHVHALRLLIDFIQGTGQHRPTELASITWELFYTERICEQLSRGEVRLLLGTLPELVNPALPATRRTALYDMLRNLEPECVAFDVLVKAIGSDRQKTDMRKFMDTRRLFLDNVPPPPQQPQAIQQAIQTLQNLLNVAVGGFQDLNDAAVRIAQSIGDLSVPKLFGTDDDDRAVMATNALNSVGRLGHIPVAYKLELIHKMIGTGTDAVEDDEEQAALKILVAAKQRSAAEFLQLVRGRSWEILDSAFDGTEHNSLEELFVF